MQKLKLIFLIGISGSGKSTYIRSHFIPECVVSPDELRKKFTGDVSDQSQNAKIWGMVPRLLKEKMEQYGKAVLDATNVDSGDRAKILKDFDRKEVERIAVVFDTDPEEAKRRIHKDLESGKDRSVVPDDVIDKQHLKFKRGYNSIKQQFDKVIDGNRGRSEIKEGKIKDFFKYNVLRGVPSKDIYLNKVTNGMAFKHNNKIYIAIRKFDGSNRWVAQNAKTLEISDFEEDYILQNSLPYKKKGQKNPINYDKKELKPNMKTKREINENIIRKIVSEEMKSILQEDATDATEEQNYKVYQDMYFTPQSNWKQKKYVPMLSAKGKEYTGKLGEIHKIQTVEYDLFHHGEVVTECGGETYSIDADDFRNSFEMVNDEEGEKVNNETTLQEEKNYNFDVVSKFAMVNNIKHGTEFNDYLKTEDMYYYGTIKDFYEDKKRSRFKQITHPADMSPELRPNHEFDLEIAIPYNKAERTDTMVVYKIIPYDNASIKEEIKKLVKIKDYFGKNIKESIEKLEKTFLTETRMYDDFELNRGDVIKFTNNMANLHVSKGDKVEIVSDEFFDNMGSNVYKIKNLRNNKTYTVETSLLHTAFVKNYAYMSDYDREPEDAYLDQDFEDRISGTEDYGDMYETKLQKEISARDRLGYENDWARKHYRQYMIFRWYKNSYDYYNESYNTIKEAQDRIEELKKDKFNKQMQFFIVDRKTKKRVPEKDLNLEKTNER